MSETTPFVYLVEYDNNEDYDDHYNCVVGIAVDWEGALRLVAERLQSSKVSSPYCTVTNIYSDGYPTGDYTVVYADGRTTTVRGWAEVGETPRTRVLPARLY